MEIELHCHSHFTKHLRPADDLDYEILFSYLKTWLIYKIKGDSFSAVFAHNYTLRCKSTIRSHSQCHTMTQHLIWMSYPALFYILKVTSLSLSHTFSFIFFFFLMRERERDNIIKIHLTILRGGKTPIIVIWLITNHNNNTLQKRQPLIQSFQSITLSYKLGY